MKNQEIFKKAVAVAIITAIMTIAPEPAGNLKGAVVLTPIPDPIATKINPPIQPKYEPEIPPTSQLSCHRNMGIIIDSYKNIGYVAALPSTDISPKEANNYFRVMFGLDNLDGLIPKPVGLGEEISIRGYKITNIENGVQLDNIPCGSQWKKAE